jgi:hypothetical protein
MSVFSVWDWEKGQFRVYRAGQDSGMYDPPAITVNGDKRVGATVEAGLVSLPYGAQFTQWSDRALGRVATDARSRSQSRAALPAGVGSLSGMGAVSLNDPTDLGTPSLLHPGLKWGPLLLLGIVGLIGLDLWHQSKRLARGKRKRANRRRNPSKDTKEAWRRLGGDPPKLILLSEGGSGATTRWRPHYAAELEASDGTVRRLCRVWPVVSGHGRAVPGQWVASHGLVEALGPTPRAAAERYCAERGIVYRKRNGTKEARAAFDRLGGSPPSLRLEPAMGKDGGYSFFLVAPGIGGNGGDKKVMGGVWREGRHPAKGRWNCNNEAWGPSPRHACVAYLQKYDVPFTMPTGMRDRTDRRLPRRRNSGVTIKKGDTVRHVPTGRVGHVDKMTRERDAAWVIWQGGVARWGGERVPLVELALVPRRANVARVDSSHYRLRPSMTVQTLIFPKTHFARVAALAWARSHGYKTDTVNETGTSYRIRQRQVGRMGPKTFRTIAFGDSGIKAVVAKKKAYAVR